MLLSCSHLYNVETLTPYLVFVEIPFEDCNEPISQLASIYHNYYKAFKYSCRISIFIIDRSLQLTIGDISDLQYSYIYCIFWINNISCSCHSNYRPIIVIVKILQPNLVLFRFTYAISIYNFINSDHNYVYYIAFKATMTTK